MGMNCAILPCAFNFIDSCNAVCRNAADAHEQASCTVDYSDLCVPVAHIGEELPAPPTPSSLHTGPAVKPRTETTGNEGQGSKRELRDSLVFAEVSPIGAGLRNTTRNRSETIGEIRMPVRCVELPSLCFSFKKPWAAQLHDQNPAVDGQNPMSLSRLEDAA